LKEEQQKFQRLKQLFSTESPKDRIVLVRYRGCC
jgi:hypothetical protein